ncbi:endogenous retrovirus group 3 member 1 Env polyprotein-like [Pantherophis guttatus]|uniref:Endogenous retrovirus group 3 member 1 Env polyprotein-like n=1 Tax=Pantherophis guttatus TaxID=94885 RepID=A0A6P9DQJ4_PANGU|nr:endogenous retrovirus group 3 member 1 Env polyprotein-like [Pantherophis guttatus]
MAPTFTLAQQLILTFLILGTSTPKAEVSRSQCEQCLVTTRRGNKVTKTLVYHSHYNCKEQTTSCVHNTTSYEICPNNGSPICFNPHGTGADPYGQIEIKITKTVHQPQRFTVFHSFYEEMETKMNIPSVTKNLFIDLAERIVSSLNVTNCYVCGGANVGEQWPWESREVNLTTLHQMNLTWSSVDRPREWNLKTSIIGNTCFQRTSSRLVTIPLGDLVCQNVLAANDSATWWSGTNGSRPDNPFSSYKQLSSIWDRLHDASFSWPAPDGLFWICGKKAYVSLPEKWSGTCVLGTINPSFFLLPIVPGKRLGVQMSDEIGQRQKRSLQITSQNTWGNDDWPTERSIQIYGPATWAEDGMNGYRTPIYLPNHLIRLQADVETITNAMSTSPELLAKSNTQIPTAAYQKRLASDYLLAQEDGVCRKCNPSNCCIKIDDTTKMIKEITDSMMKVAHVPVQTWNGAVDFNSFGGIFSGWKRIGFLVLLALEVSSSPVSLH